MMGKPSRPAATILIASDNIADGELIKTILDAEFDNVFISTAPDRIVEDFELRRPNVLLLAFDSLEKSEHYYHALRTRSNEAGTTEHRVIVLCDKNNIGRAYQLCKKERFHDYVFFWPMTHDAPRLLMSLHLAIRELTMLDASPTAEEFAAQARRLSEMETLLHKHVAHGNREIEIADSAMRKAEREIGAALDEFSRQLAQEGPPDVGEHGLTKKFDSFKQNEIDPRLRSFEEVTQPLKLWIDGFSQECVPHIKAARTLNEMADRLQPTVLVVDDDDFQQTIVAKILEPLNYRVLYAESGLAALEILRNVRPDLVLMDLMMPDVNGIETTRRLKAMPAFANLPVMMMTGKSEGDIVIESLQAGVIDFVVKPVERETLIGKVAQILRTTKMNRALAQKKWDDL
ncbi:response regulator [Nitrosospira sp. Is2]|uniref:response regulator n=1 Tax=Nitrosospira sp. Is2 TaxID=3080532 RepID=UPI002952D619|nr:response regulator [Nitrosospira sp. Is2]WON75243.1 response regulator [Nitrosospira sp. Is2]